MEQLPLITRQLNKTEIKMIAQQSVDDLLENGNPLFIAETLSKMELFIKEVKADSRFTEYVREELIKYGNKKETESGTKLEIAETGVDYDFTNCNCEKWKQLNEQLTNLKKDIKEREEFLKRIPYQGIKELDEETGTLVHLYPPAKTSKSSYKVTIAK